MSRRRPAFLAGLAATWIAAIAIIAAPTTSAVPAASPRTLDPGAFAPVSVPQAVVAGRATTLDAAAAAPKAEAAPTPGAIVEPAPPVAALSRPVVRVPAPAARSVIKLPKTSHALAGRASWYCKAGVSICMSAHPDGPGADLYAAAGPALRRAMCGSDTSNCWRGRRVVVDGIVVVLADWCQCSKGKATEKIIDLYWDAWSRIPGVSDGVTVRW